MGHDRNKGGGGVGGGGGFGGGDTMSICRKFG